jgi:hypothetical protein
VQQCDVVCSSLGCHNCNNVISSTVGWYVSGKTLWPDVRWTKAKWYFVVYASSEYVVCDGSEYPRWTVWCSFHLRELLVCDIINVAVWCSLCKVGQSVMEQCVVVWAICRLHYQPRYQRCNNMVWSVPNWDRGCDNVDFSSLVCSVPVGAMWRDLPMASIFWMK